MKKCFTCRNNYPMCMYHLDESRYKIKANKGKTIECRFCTLKRNLNDKGFTHRVDGKFTFTQASKKQIISKKCILYVNSIYICKRVRSETILNTKGIALSICRNSDLCILMGLFYSKNLNNYETTI